MFHFGNYAFPSWHHLHIQIGRFGILHNWNIRVQDLTSATDIKLKPRIVCQQHWDLFCYVAHLREHCWERRVLAFDAQFCRPGCTCRPLCTCRPALFYCNGVRKTAPVQKCPHEAKSFGLIPACAFVQHMWAGNWDSTFLLHPSWGASVSPFLAAHVGFQIMICQNDCSAVGALSYPPPKVSYFF